MKLALVYDRINKWGGAERLLTHLHALWPKAPVYTGVYHPSTAPWAKDWDIRPSFVNRLPFASANHEWYFWLIPLAFETFNFDGFDTILSVCSDFTKGVITKPNHKHISYIFSPTRYLWFTPNEYKQWRNLFFMPVILNQLRYWDYLAAQRPDEVITISQHVRRLIQKYYHRDAKVVYPPVDTNFFKPATSYKLQATSYFLVVSRLVPHKNLELAITAFNQLRLPLKIVGTGRHEPRLRRLAGPTIEFIGKLTDRQLLGYYQDCRGLIFPGEESFGLTMVEAQACGKPVIAFSQGGAKEIIIDGQTGILFNEPTTKSLSKAIRIFQTSHFNWQKCRSNSQRFNLDRFNRQMKAIL